MILGQTVLEIFEGLILYWKNEHDRGLSGRNVCLAVCQKIGPSWILYNLATLYWRIVGNTINGLECARRALYFVPDEYRDVPLLNLANILYRVGRVDDAIVLMREALSINDFEVWLIKKLFL